MAATTVAGLSVATSLAGSGMSFAQAISQNELQRTAEAKATQAMEEARKLLDVNFYEGLSVNKDPYAFQRDALLASGAQAIDAAATGDQRGVGAVAGRVQMAQTDAERALAVEMGREQDAIKTAIAQENAALQQQKVALETGTVKGAQEAAASAEANYAWNMNQGFSGVQSALDVAQKEFVPLYNRRERDAADLAYQNSQKINQRLVPKTVDKPTTLQRGMPSSLPDPYASVKYTPTKLSESDYDQSYFNF